METSSLSSPTEDTSTIQFPPYRTLSADYLQPYNDFVQNEEPFIREVIKPNAIALAKEYVAKTKITGNADVDQPSVADGTASSSSSSSVSSSSSSSAAFAAKVKPSFRYTDLPVQCYDPMYGNFLANAFHWSIEFSNEVRRLRGELYDHAVPSSSSSGSSSSSSSVPFLSHCRLRMTVPSDVSTIMGFVRELALFEREPEAVVTNEELLLRDGFTPGRLFHCFLVEIPIAVYEEFMQRTLTPIPEHITTARPAWVPISFAFVHAIYSTWQGKSLYLEDLYVSPVFRRMGISTLCFEAISRVGVITKSARFQWSALNWNTPAINAYVGPRIRAEHLDEWNLYRLYRDGIERIAHLSCY